MWKIQKNKGFTLIELILVSTILIVVLNIAVSKADLFSFELKTQGRQLCTDIREIRFSQMTQGGAFRILMADESYQVLNGIKQIRRVPLKKGYQLLYRKNEVMFNYQGVPIHGGDTIKIQHIRSGKYMEITIVPASGRVLLKDEIVKP